MALLIQTWLTLELNCVIKGFTGPVAQIFFLWAEQVEAPVF